MKNPFKRKKNEGLFLLEIPIGAFARMSAFDASISDPQTITEILGLPQMSDDVAEMEEEASLNRLSVLTPISHLLLLHASVLSETMAMYQSKHSPNGEEMDDDEVERMKKLYQAVSLTSTLSALSVLSEYGLIEIMGRELSAVTTNE